jgi:sugar (pentulose or hexulose) kinase
MNAPVSVMKTAGEGGPWGMALLASYLVNKEKGEPLESFLSQKVFAGEKGITLEPNPTDVKGFEAFSERYKRYLAVERAAVENVK